MRFFAVKEKSTGFYITPKRQRCATHQPTGPCPRLFEEKCHAVSSMKWYVAGMIGHKYAFSNFDPCEMLDTAELVPAPGTERNAKDFTVVAVTVLEIEYVN